MERLRKIFESIAYAGIKPGQRPRSGTRMGRLESLASSLTQLLDGRPPADPFYVTNRSVGQRLRLAALIAVPGLVLATALGLEAIGYLNPSIPLPPVNVVVPKEGTEIRIDSTRDIEISEVHIDAGPEAIVRGRALNSTDRVLRDVELVFDLINPAGSRLGSVSTVIPTMRPRSSVPFAFPVRQRDAAFALIRQAQSR